MISIIICSRQSSIPEDLRYSISKTIGEEYELIIIDNSKSEYSLFSAYNEGVDRSSGDILCFCHDDIMFHSLGWGHTVLSHFKDDKDLGILGVAGSHFLPSTPMYWSSSPFISEHNLNNDNGVYQEFFHDDFFRDNNRVEVVAIDGLCFFMPHKVFESVRFDDGSYSGFHLYDMDICMQAIASGYKVAVCNDILVEHSWSEKECANKKGYEVMDFNLSVFCKKWKDMLPISRGISLPAYSIDRINRLYTYANDARLVRKTKAYRLGRAILKPFKLFIKKK